MKQAVPYFGRFLSKLVLEIIPGALVSVFAAYLLSMLHLGAEPVTPPQNVTAVQNDGLSGDERRELTRQMLKERRENPEEPAEVKPIPSLRPAGSPTSTADLSVPHDHVAAPPATAESKLHAESEAKPHPGVGRDDYAGCSDPVAARARAPPQDRGCRGSCAAAGCCRADGSDRHCIAAACRRHGVRRCFNGRRSDRASVGHRQCAGHQCPGRQCSNQHPGG
jgi:hypothetical protein